MPLRPTLSLVLPALNEAENLAVALPGARRQLALLCEDFEIIVVDDGSIDDTAQVVRAAAAEDPRVRLVQHPRNRGYGSALRSGFHAARFERVAFTDADLQFDLAELGPLLDLSAWHDVVIGYRAQRQDPWNRRLNAWAWGQLVNRTFDLSVRDVNCAFKVFRRDLLQELALRSEGAFVNTELLAQLRARGASIREVPVTHRPRLRGEQTGAKPRVVLRAFVELAGLYGELRAQEGAATSRGGLRAALSR
jgi:glycosyltransferase involved in cell wall biosynthesis